MTQYVALLRGIAPSNPNMANSKLRGVARDLGFDEVQTVISSGNLLFESETEVVGDLETRLESAWTDSLGFESTTIIRTRQDLEALIDLGPFGDLAHSPKTYLLVTFAKHRLALDFEYPYQPPGKAYQVVGSTSREIFSVTDTTPGGTPDLMSWLDDRLGRQISSRTWLTVSRILNRMSG
jgi:uncharacterized protein (DUF1697 family)